MKPYKPLKQTQPRDRIGRFARFGAWVKKTRRKVRKAKRMLSPTYHVKQHARKRRHFQRQDFERRYTLMYGTPPPKPKRRRRASKLTTKPYRKLHGPFGIVLHIPKNK